jgi:hypothetical protein
LNITELSAAYTVALGNQDIAIKALSLVVYLPEGKAERKVTIISLTITPHKMIINP